MSSSFQTLALLASRPRPHLHTLLRIASVLEVDPGVLIAGLSGDMVTARPHKLTAAELIRARQS
jgi:hypothetical protein